MKKKCKNIDITDAQTVRPWVEDCIRRHKKRHDFRKLIRRHGVSEEDYWKAVDEHDFSLIEPAVDRIAEEAGVDVSTVKRAINRNSFIYKYIPESDPRLNRK